MTDIQIILTFDGGDFNRQVEQARQALERLAATVPGRPPTAPTPPHSTLGGPPVPAAPADRTPAPILPGDRVQVKIFGPGPGEPHQNPVGVVVGTCMRCRTYDVDVRLDDSLTNRRVLDEADPDGMNPDTEIPTLSHTVFERDHGVLFAPLPHVTRIP